MTPRTPVRKHKYGAKKVVVDGIRFDSKREAKRWSDLLILERAGEITNLERQVPIGLMGQNAPIMTDSGKQVRRYIADFRYQDKNGVTVIEDAKGFPTEGYKIKRAILAAMGVEVREV